ncbi:glucosamine--fructose-6-phosphate aminotransferase (isomerizing) [Rhizobium skierniewicense]|uniref:Glucosamine--fructose-6-phosphate aminotransferase (Isomerizing) n=1 Tax=Rhizobium skierniewicense TaxID=984260 RepID=A0A7W6CBW9_9HYPH|nr:SIS domain-containing protein [Rhizobium skierniewicense]MBB3944401.1 glucosamine--fructose-6-phosphate aminotransferase (isomerizing) [Rhizobium skierniewicense]
MTTLMRQEIDEIPDAVARLLETSLPMLEEAGRNLKAQDPAVIVTIARGSSDHAAHFMKYAIELQTGLPVASLGPSLASIYDAPLKLERAAALAISQSGKSPDIVALARNVKRGGALTFALVNTLSSPLADASTQAIDIQAGPEKAVAATKSFVNSIVAGLSILAAATEDQLLVKAIAALPANFAKAIELDWSEIAQAIKGEDSLYMLGRGPALAIASEAALKCKETCELHAEAYSSAEVMHGPVSLVAPRFPIIAFAARDRAEASVAETANGLAAKGANVFLTSAKATSATALPFVETNHPLTDALLLIAPFYGFIEALSRARGFNPDAPVALNKVTQTR